MRYFFWFGLVLFACAVALHLSTFVPDREPLPMELLFPLFVFTFVLFFLAIVIIKRNKPFGSSTRPWKEILAAVPRWVPAGLIVLMSYTGFNFFYSLWHLNGNLTPEIKDGHYVLHNHGQVVRELTQAQYWQHKAWQLRGFSMHPIMFLAVSLAVIWGHLRDKVQGATNGVNRFS